MYKGERTKKAAVLGNPPHGQTDHFWRSGAMFESRFWESVQSSKLFDPFFQPTPFQPLMR
jgi:hypothetical protein